MKKIDIYFYNRNAPDENMSLIETKQDSVKVNIYLLDSDGQFSTYNLLKELKKLKSIIGLYNDLKRINIIFEKDLNESMILTVVTKLHDILYSYMNRKGQEIKLYNVTDKAQEMMEVLTSYKDIVMDPNKTSTSYLEWVKKNVPSNYNIDIMSEGFPLIEAVGRGSQNPYYFVFISPKEVDENKTDIYMVGKAVTYDTGGLNVKTSHMHEMKTDMIGSAIILSVLNLLNTPINLHNNVFLLLPIVENMIGPAATKPGTVVQTRLGKTVEIIDTDAEGRLCIADCMEYIEKILRENKRREMTLILDIATLTGNASRITHTISCVTMSNKIGVKYNSSLVKIGNKIGEYVDYLQLRKEYDDYMQSNVADIKNHCDENKAGCMMGGAFINYFVNKNTPWLHLDVAGVTYIKDMPTSYGINLLYQFLKSN
jgi:leucyl aminopeptidase